MFLLRLLSFFILLLSSTNLQGRPIKISSSLREYDQFLKSVNDNEPEDEFDDVDNSAQNSWELSGKFEGDIILSDQQQKVLLQEEAQPGLARNGLNDVSKRWPGNTLVYEIHDSHFTGEQKQGIRDAMDDLERSSCIKFKERDSSDSDYVMIQGKRRGCFSRVGYQGGGAQVLNLTPHPVGLGCMSHGTITHELLHALGFFHMQSHTKRDDYVKIHWDNILEGRENNFKKYNSFVSSDYGVPYDYDSVLHYSAHAFSKNGRKTIVPKSSGFVQIGQRLGPSDKDILKLNRMYKCGGGGGSGRVGSFGGSSSKGGIEPFDSDIQFNDGGLHTFKNNTNHNDGGLYSTRDNNKQNGGGLYSTRDNNKQNGGGLYSTRDKNNHNDGGLYTTRDNTAHNIYRPGESHGYDVYEHDEPNHHEPVEEDNTRDNDEPSFSTFWSRSHHDADSFPKSSYEFSGWWER